MYEPRGTKTRRRLRERVARQQAERFVRLNREQPTPPAPAYSILDDLRRMAEEGGEW
jgi:hypothetical protein